MPSYTENNGAVNYITILHWWVDVEVGEPRHWSLI